MKRLGTVSPRIVELDAHVARQRSGPADAFHEVGVSQFGGGLAACASRTGELTRVQHEGKVCVVDLPDERDDVITGAAQRTVVVVLEADRNSGARRLLAYAPDGPRRPVESLQPLRFSWRRAGKNTEKRSAEQLRDPQRLLSFAELRGVQTFGESKVRRDREHGDRQTTVEVDPPDLLEVIGVGTREILQVKTGSFEIELAAERKEAGDVHLARGKQARVIQRVVADFHRKPCRVLSCLGEDITPAPRADSRCKKRVCMLEPDELVGSQA